MRRHALVPAGLLTVVLLAAWFVAKHTARRDDQPKPDVTINPPMFRHRRWLPIRVPVRAALGKLGLVTLVFLAVALAAGPPSFAYFTTSGLGSGPGTTGSLQPLVIQSATTGSPSTSLLPGTTADLLLNLTNPNPGAVTLVSVTQGGGVAVQGGGGCTNDPGWPGTLGNSGVTVVSSTGLSIPIAGGATAVVHIPGGAAMTTASASGCQGATFQIPVTVVVRQ